MCNAHQKYWYQFCLIIILYLQINYCKSLKMSFIYNQMNVTHSCIIFYSNIYVNSNLCSPILDIINCSVRHKSFLKFLLRNRCTMFLIQVNYNNSNWPCLNSLWLYYYKVMNSQGMISLGPAAGLPSIFFRWLLKILSYFIGLLEKKVSHHNILW